MFSLPYVIVYISMVFWIFPAIRNYKTVLFFYFLIWAVADPIVMAISVLSPLHALKTYLPLTFFTFLSLKGIVTNKSNFNKLLVFAFILNFWAAFYSSKIVYLVIIFDHIIITLFFVTRLLNYVALNSKVKVFHIILFLYEVSLVMKLLFLVFDVQTGTSYFMTTNIFQMLIAVFFSIYKEADNKLIIDLQNV